MNPDRDGWFQKAVAKMLATSHANPAPITPLVFSVGLARVLLARTLPEYNRRLLRIEISQQGYIAAVVTVAQKPLARRKTSAPKHQPNSPRHQSARPKLPVEERIETNWLTVEAYQAQLSTDYKALPYSCSLIRYQLPWSQIIAHFNGHRGHNPAGRATAETGQMVRAAALAAQLVFVLQWLPLHEVWVCPLVIFAAVRRSTPKQELE